MGAALTPGQVVRPASPARARSFRLGNRPALTGLRGIGIAAVLTFHSNFETLPGAWEALGMFFTLSGFLITAMLVGEAQRNGRFSLRRFYVNRAVRLGPPLLIALGLVAVIAALTHPLDPSGRVWGDSLAALFYYSDYRQALGHEPLLGFMAQAWSLSVEEQFYLLWSLLLALAMAAGRQRRKIAYVLAGAGFVACTVNRELQAALTPHLGQAGIDRLYYAFDTRADAIFLGCLLGLVASGDHLEAWGAKAKRVCATLALGAGALVAWALFAVPLGHVSVVTWGIPLTEVAWATILLHLVVSPSGLGARVVGWKPIVWLGDISYMLYLVHWPVYVAWYAPPHDFWPYEALRLAIVFSVAVSSWFLVEKPLRTWRRRRES